MPPMDTSAPYYPISLQLDPNFNWPSGNNCLEMYDVKSETGDLPAPALNSAAESCMSKVFQGVYQRSGILPPARHLPSTEGLNPVLSDPPALGGLDNIQPVKCAYSTVTSAQRVDPFLNGRVPLLQQELSFGGNDGWKSAVPVPAVARGDDRQNFSGGSYSYRVVSRGQRPALPLGATSAAMESESLSQNENQGARRNIPVTRCLSDEASLDDVIPTSSTVSSASGSLAREQEEDDALCTTSSEPSSQLGRTQSRGVTAGIESIVLSHHDEQQKQMSGLASAVGSSHSAVDQRDIGSPGSNSRGALKDHDSAKKVDARCHLVNDAKESNHMPLAMDLKHNHDDLGMIVDGDSWRKDLKSPTVSGVYFSEQSPNLVNVASAPIASTGFFIRNNSSNIRHPHGDTRNPLNASANNLGPEKPAVALKETLMRDTGLANLAHAMMFNATYAAVDMAAVESSRPKRRNVKISKDPQSVAARHRRERISDRIRVLQRLVPGGTKMDTASMLDEAIHYVKFLKAQVQTLENVSNAAGSFDPRLIQHFPGYRNPSLPYTPMPMDCAAVSQGLSSAPDHGVYGAGPQIHSYSSYPDTCREQFCH